MTAIIPEVIYERHSFGNAWYKALNHVLKTHHEITFGGKIRDKVPPQYEKKKALDSDTTIVLEGNALHEAIAKKLHPQFPTKEMHKEAYLREWERGFDWVKQGFTYCYESRIEDYPDNKYCLDGTEEDVIDQWKFSKENLASQIIDGFQSNRNVIVIGSPAIDQYCIPDSPPCLREIWIRWEGGHNVSVKTIWRSRDLYSAWMSNVIGLLSAVMREVVTPNDCSIIQYVDKSHSLHIYSYDIESASRVKPIQINPMLMG